MAVHVALRVVEAGAMRFVDLRTVPRDDFFAASLFAAVGRSLAAHGPWESWVFVMPASFTTVLAELTNVAQRAYWPHVRAAAVGATMLLVYVDGAAVRPRAIDCAKQCGVTIALEWPIVIGTDPVTGLVRTWRGDELLA